MIKKIRYSDELNNQGMLPIRKGFIHSQIHQIRVSSPHSQALLTLSLFCIFQYRSGVFFLSGGKLATPQISFWTLLGGWTSASFLLPYFRFIFSTTGQVVNALLRLRRFLKDILSRCFHRITSSSMMEWIPHWLLRYKGINWFFTHKFRKSTTK